MSGALLFLILGFFILGFEVYKMGRYIFFYIKASSKWQLIDAEVISIKEYPMTYGNVPKVSFVFNDQIIQSDIIISYFSKYLVDQNVQIWVNPRNLKDCIILNKRQLIKNILLMLFFITLYVTILVIWLNGK